MNAHRQTLTALKRFGLGARPGDLAAVAKDPRGYVLAQIDRPDAARMNDRSLGNTAELMRRHAAFLRGRKEAGATKNSGAAPTMKMEPAPASLHYLKEAKARIGHAIATDNPFVERWVDFWSDHFCISAAKNGRVRVAAGAYEREVIRPHVFGHFADMLTASARHPAMLIYLDNAVSRGPNSPKGLETGKGLNENLAREILELHTLGVGGGYSQADVTEFARILTGWTVGGALSGKGSVFAFRPGWHEPGAFRVLGKTYEQKGLGKGMKALADFARHPATARHIATKLVRHFLTHEPRPEAVDVLAQAFRDSEGNLAELARALVRLDLVWSEPAKRLIPPYDMLVAVGRAFGWNPQGKEIRRFLTVLGQPLWQPPSPAGWPDEDNSWAAPDALLERLDWGETRIARISEGIDPRRHAVALFGEGLSESTSRAIATAESRAQGLALLVMSPEFQRR